MFSPIATGVAVVLVVVWIGFVAWPKIKAMLPAKTQATGNVVAAKAGIATVWVAVQAIAEAARANNDQATVAAALALLPACYKWDDEPATTTKV